MSISIKKGVSLVVMALLLIAPMGALDAGPISITDVTQEWYFPEWLGTSPHAPSFQVRDTTYKYGRYTKMTKIISLKDLIKFHGHVCGGLVESAGALKLAFDQLFPDGIIDRTDLRIISNNSACGGDVASYLTGARLRFASHHIDRALKESEFIVQKVSTGETVRVCVRPEAYPTEVRKKDEKDRVGKIHFPGPGQVSGTSVELCPEPDNQAFERVVYGGKVKWLPVA